MNLLIHVVYMCVFMYVCMYVYVYVCMYYVCIMFVCMYVTCVCIHVRIYGHVCIYMYMHVSMYTCVHVCLYICMCVRRCIFSYLCKYQWYDVWCAYCFFYVHVTVHRDKFPYNKTNSFRAGSGCNCSFILILLESCLQTCTTYTIAECTVNNSCDGQRNSPKNVEFHFQNKFEKLMHLVGFIVRKKRPTVFSSLLLYATESYVY
jgi:nuclear pore complex protein Nup62